MMLKTWLRLGGTKAWEVIKYLFFRVRSLSSESDPEPVVGVCVTALLLYGGTLMAPGDSFHDPVYRIMAEIFPNESAVGGVLFGLGIWTGLSLLMKRPFLQVLCVIMVAVFAFIGTTFVLLGVGSTGNTYYVYALGAAWASWRLIERNE